MSAMKFKRQLGSGRAESPGGRRCPEIWELEDGTIAVIGRDITSEANLPKEVMLGTEERVVLIPRSVLVAASEKI